MSGSGPDCSVVVTGAGAPPGKAPPPGGALGLIGAAGGMPGGLMQLNLQKCYTTMSGADPTTIMRKAKGGVHNESDRTLMNPSLVLA